MKRNENEHAAEILVTAKFKVQVEDAKDIDSATKLIERQIKGIGYSDPSGYVGIIDIETKVKK